MRQLRPAATPATPRQPPAATCPFAVGERVEHPKWGEATVQRYEDDKVVVLFDTVGYKALRLDAVAENGLLSAGVSVHAARGELLAQAQQGEVLGLGLEHDVEVEPRPGSA